MTGKSNFHLSRNSFGQLVLATNDERVTAIVVPVRAFPISAPDAGIALVDEHGHELVWVEQLSDLSEDLRTLVESELIGREFMPEIKRIKGVSSFATPSTWEVETDHGSTSFALNGEEDIRRLASPSLLIADSNGINYLIRDRYALDQHSRKILDRFL